MHRPPFALTGKLLSRLVILMVAGALLSGCARSTNFKYWDERVPAGMGTTVVRPGDTLYSIAVANDLDWRAVARWNGIRDPRTLRVGQRLRLTPPTSNRVRPAPPPPRQATHRAPSRPLKPPTTSSSDHGRDALHWLWPARGKVVSRFIDGSNVQKGLIISGALGEPIYASTAGEVVYAGNGLPGYGNLLIIKYDGTWLSAYGYNQTLLVKEGEQVKAGQRVALMGRRDGRALDTTGSLLFQIRRDGKPVDPLHYLPKR